MKNPSSKDLDRFLQEYYRQENEHIQPPCSKERWADLQARLKNLESAEIASALGESTLAETDSAFKKGYSFFRKHRVLTSLAAACLLMAVFFWNHPPVDTFKEAVFGGAMLSESEEREEGEEGEETLFLAQALDEEELFTPSLESDDGHLPAEEPLPPAEKAPEKEPVRQPTPVDEAEKAADPTAEDVDEVTVAAVADEPADTAVDLETADPDDVSADLPAEYTDEQVPTGETDRITPPPQPVDIAETDPSAQERAVAEGETVQSHFFSKQAAFLQALKMEKADIAEEMWYARELPGRYQFSHAAISKLGSALHHITQYYNSPEGVQHFVLTQSFFPSAAEAREAYSQPDVLVQPVQVGPYEGYFLTQHDGTQTIAWLQHKSMLTLSARLEKARLLEILESLAYINAAPRP